MSGILWDRLVATGVLVSLALFVGWVMSCGNKAFKPIGWLLGAVVIYETALMLVMVWGWVRP